MSDPSGTRFPWRPLSKEEKQKQLLETLGSELVAKIAGKPFALYFSAHWCPPCRGFTPKLAEWYTAGLKAKWRSSLFPPIEMKLLSKSTLQKCRGNVSLSKTGMPKLC